MYIYAFGRQTVRARASPVRARALAGCVRRACVRARALPVSQVGSRSIWFARAKEAFLFFFQPMCVLPTPVNFRLSKICLEICVGMLCCLKASKMLVIDDLAIFLDDDV